VARGTELTRHKLLETIEKFPFLGQTSDRKSIGGLTLAEGRANPNILIFHLKTNYWFSLCFLKIAA
jgi:hypothetical protein